MNSAKSATDPKPVMEVREIWKRFPGRHRQAEVDAVRGVSFAIRKGETVALVGESGSGKTTLGRCIIGLEKPSSGEILLDGEQIARAGESMHGEPGRLQTVFQDPSASLDPRIRIGASIEEPLFAIGIGRPERRLRVDEACGLARFPRAYLGRYPHELSAGQQQRGCIARALVTRPELIVLDEPTSMLDASLRAGLVTTLRDLQRRLGVSFLFITHDLTVVRRIAHKVLVMYSGRVVESGPPERILTRPVHPYTQALRASVLLPIRPQAPEVPEVRMEGRVAQPLQGCSYAPRCPLAEEGCWSRVPELVELEEGHWAACFVREREFLARRDDPLVTIDRKGSR